MDDVQYDKRFTNRNKIISTYGWTWISVPIKKEHKLLPNVQVEINNDLPWMAEHWRKIYMSYANAKFFHLYRDYLENLYKGKWEFLFDLNHETLKKTIEWLGIRIELIRESELNVTGKGTQRLINVCKAIGADTYISGRGGAGYMDEKLFEKNGVRLEYQIYTPPLYPQRLSNSFIPDLSIIDMLANVGPDSLRVMTGKQPIEFADGPVTQNSVCATGR